MIKNLSNPIENEEIYGDINKNDNNILDKINKILEVYLIKKKSTLSPSPDLKHVNSKTRFRNVQFKANAMLKSYKDRSSFKEILTKTPKHLNVRTPKALSPNCSETEILPTIKTIGRYSERLRLENISSLPQIKNVNRVDNKSVDSFCSDQI